MKQIRNLVIPAAVFLILFPQASVFAFSVGPYSLGMSSAQARKAGITDCVADHHNTIKCRATISGDMPVKEAAIWFDKSTQRAQRISVRIVYDHLPVDDPFEDHMKALHIARCSKDRSISGKESFEEWCYERGGGTRLITSIRSKGGLRPFKPYQSIDIKIELDAAHVRAFEKKKAENARDRRIANSIEHGRT